MQVTSRKVIDFGEIATQVGLVSAADLSSAPHDLHQTSDAFLPKSRFVACVCEGFSVGANSLVETILRRNRQMGTYAAFIDINNSLDIDTLPSELLETLLWVRPKTMMQALKCADILLRDTNFGSINFDLRERESQTHSISATSWYRIQRLCHKFDGWFLLIANQHISPSVDVCLTLGRPHRLDALDELRDVNHNQLMGRVAFQLANRHVNRQSAV